MVECPEGYVRVATIAGRDDDPDGPVIPWLVHPGCLAQVELEPDQIVLDGIARRAAALDCAVCEKPL